MILPRPVLVRYVDDTEVHVMDVEPTEFDAFGIPESGRFRLVGRVKRVRVVAEDGFEVARWRGKSINGEHVHAATKRKATAALLASLGLFPIGANDTIPRLF